MQASADSGRREMLNRVQGRRTFSRFSELLCVLIVAFKN